jgi:hypothetical protein
MVTIVGWLLRRANAGFGQQVARGRAIGEQVACCRPGISSAPEPASRAVTLTRTALVAAEAARQIQTPSEDGAAIAVTSSSPCAFNA